MNRLFSLVLVGTFLIGCQQAQDQIQSTGEQAVRSAGKALSSGWASVQEETRLATERTSKDALQALKAKLVDLQSQISGMKAPSQLDQLKLDSIKQQIAKIDAAIDIQDLRAKLDEKVKQASELKENAGKTYDDVRQRLDRMDADYRDLRQKLDGAQQVYQEAAKKVGM